MKKKIIKFTLRTSEDISQKFQYVAGYSAHSAKRELESVIKRYITEFEKKHGPILLE